MAFLRVLSKSNCISQHSSPRVDVSWSKSSDRYGPSVQWHGPEVREVHLTGFILMFSIEKLQLIYFMCVALGEWTCLIIRNLGIMVSIMLCDPHIIFFSFYLCFFFFFQKTDMHWLVGDICIAMSAILILKKSKDQKKKKSINLENPRNFI